jgi:hypothetical protein
MGIGIRREGRGQRIERRHGEYLKKASPQKRRLGRGGAYGSKISQYNPPIRFYSLAILGGITIHPTAYLQWMCPLKMAVLYHHFGVSILLLREDMMDALQQTFKQFSNGVLHGVHPLFKLSINRF